MREYGLYIGGEWVGGASGETFQSFNPYRQQPWATLREATEAEVDAAVQAAQKGNETWRAMNGGARAEILNRIAAVLSANGDDLAELELELIEQVLTALIRP